MALSFPYGYGSWATTLTEAQLDTKWTWYRLAPEFRRRLISLFTHAWHAGTAVGIGGGARSYRQQYESWLRDPTTFAKPGNSYHEDNAYQGAWGCAADLIGNLKWMNANAERFGLKHFANVNSEPWHVQPVEVPNARRYYIASVHEMAVWPLPVITPPKPPKPPVEPPTVKEITVNLPFETLRVETHQGVVSQWAKNVQGLINTRAGQTVVEVDGRYGPKTEAIVRLIQTEEGIVVDGVCGPQTLGAIWDGR